MSISRNAILLVVGIAAASTKQTTAACGSGNRISHRDAVCLEAMWHNPSEWSFTSQESVYTVQNTCARLGTVVAKVDIRGDMDRTLHLGSSTPRSGHVLGRIRSIYCCADLSDLCSP